MNYTLSSLKGKSFAVRCQTLEGCGQVLSIFRSEGFDLAPVPIKPGMDIWDIYKEDTCYTICLSRKEVILKTLESCWKEKKDILGAAKFIEANSANFEFSKLTRGKYSVYCKSKEEALNVLSILDQNGLYWTSGCNLSDHAYYSNPEHSYFFEVGMEKESVSHSQTRYNVQWDVEAMFSAPQFLSANKKEKKMEKTYIVDEGFIKEAYGAACDTWRKKLKAKFPEAFEAPLSIGDRLLYSNAGLVCEYLVTCVSPNKYVAIDIADGNRWRNPIECKPTELTLSKLVGEDKAVLFSKIIKKSS